MVRIIFSKKLSMRFSMNPIFDFIFAMFAEKLIVLVRKVITKLPNTEE